MLDFSLRSKLNCKLNQKQIISFYQLFFQNEHIEMNYFQILMHHIDCFYMPMAIPALQFECNTPVSKW
jgi:hypothetical protein